MPSTVNLVKTHGWGGHITSQGTYLTVVLLNEYGVELLSKHSSVCLYIISPVSNPC